MSVARLERVIELQDRPESGNQSSSGPYWLISIKAFFTTRFGGDSLTLQTRIRRLKPELNDPNRLLSIWVALLRGN